MTASNILFVRPFPARNKELLVTLSNFRATSAQLPSNFPHQLRTTASLGHLWQVCSQQTCCSANQLSEPLNLFGKFANDERSQCTCELPFALQLSHGLIICCEAHTQWTYSAFHNGPEYGTVSVLLRLFAPCEMDKPSNYIALDFGVDNDTCHIFMVPPPP